MLFHSCPLYEFGGVEEANRITPHWGSLTNG